MNNRGSQRINYPDVDRRPNHFSGYQERPRENRAARSLATPNEIQHLSGDVEVMTQITRWIDEYLIRSHPQLGRTGPVCPFTRGAQIRDSIRISVARLGASPDHDEIVALVRDYKQEFFRIREAMKAEDRIYTAVMIAFPDVSRALWPELIDGTKQLLKPEFVCSGLMLGEFHADNQQPGLHSEEFRPLRSPVPMLVMRQMVPSDIAFLSRPEDSPAARMEFLTAYLALQANLTHSERTRAEEALQAAFVESGSGQAND